MCTLVHTRFPCSERKPLPTASSGRGCFFGLKIERRGYARFDSRGGGGGEKRSSIQRRYADRVYRRCKSLLRSRVASAPLVVNLDKVRNNVIQTNEIRQIEYTDTREHGTRCVEMCMCGKLQNDTRQIHARARATDGRIRETYETLINITQEDV